MGVSTMKVGVDSQVKWGNTKLRVALVLDNTGSMADDGKMTRSRPRPRTLLDQLKTAAVNNGDVYVSIIPFSKDVNVGKSNYNATWIDWTDWDDDNGDDAAPRLHQANGKKSNARRRHLDAGQPQHLERLRDRPRRLNAPDPATTTPTSRRRDQQHRDAVPGRAIRQLPGADDAAELRLDGA